jgi:O-methyltransferase
MKINNRKKKNKLIRVLENLKWCVANFKNITPDSVPVNNLTFKSDGLFTQQNSDCLNEPRFKKAYDLSLTVNDWRTELNMDMRWRYYIVCWFANHVKHLEGDFVECGVYKGGYSLALADYLQFKDLNKDFWLLDTFNGLVKSYLTPAEIEYGLFEHYEDSYEECYDAVVKTFKPYPNYKIIRGPVPDTLPECKADKVCFLSIDMNITEPEIAAANYFWDKIVSGGIVILDDYGFTAHINQKLAFDAWAAQKNVPILSLPTGQAIIFKP